MFLEGGGASYERGFNCEPFFFFPHPLLSSMQLYDLCATEGQESVSKRRWQHYLLQTKCFYPPE